MINISIIHPGTLQQQLSLGEWKRTKSIAIKGCLNSEDILWIKDLTTINKGLYYINLIGIINLSDLDFPAIYERGVSNLSIENDISKLDKNTLQCLSASTINLPASVCHIDMNAFCNCTELKMLNVDEQNTHYKSVNGLLYTKAGDELLFCPPKREGTIAVPEGTTKIAAKAFRGCDRLKLLILPQSIEKAHTGSLVKDFSHKKTEIRWNADQDRFELGETFYSAGGMVLEKHSPDTEDYEEGDPHYSLYKSTEYEIHVPNKVELIQDNAFENCYQLKGVKLPSSLTQIGSNTFCNCTHLATIELPGKLKLIGEGAFNGCRNLGKICCWATKPPRCAGLLIDYTQDKMLYVPKGTLESYKKAKGWNMFRYIREVESLTTIVNRMCSGEKNAITYSSTISKCELKDYLQASWQNIGKISISGRITASDALFLREMCTHGKLTDIDLADCLLQELPKKAFADAENLVSVFLPNCMTEIPDSCFLNCKRLKKVILGDELKSIGTFAFAECWTLKSIELPFKTERIDRGAFWNCKCLDRVIFNANELNVAEDAFRGCDAIKRIENHNAEPPKCSSDTFSTAIVNNALVTFPSRAKGAFASDPIWEHFAKKNAEDTLF